MTPDRASLANEERDPDGAQRLDIDKLWESEGS